MATFGQKTRCARWAQPTRVSCSTPPTLRSARCRCGIPSTSTAGAARATTSGRSRCPTFGIGTIPRGRSRGNSNLTGGRRWPVVGQSVQTVPAGGSVPATR
jgi:hypothetical protein